MQCRYISFLRSSWSRKTSRRNKLLLIRITSRSIIMPVQSPRSYQQAHARGGPPERIDRAQRRLAAAGPRERVHAQRRQVSGWCRDDISLLLIAGTTGLMLEAFRFERDCWLILARNYFSTRFFRKCLLEIRCVVLIYQSLACRRFIPIPGLREVMHYKKSTFGGKMISLAGKGSWEGGQYLVFREKKLFCRKNAYFENKLDPLETRRIQNP